MVKSSFRKALTDLITDLHHSNKPGVQITLDGENLMEEKFFLLGFVKAEDMQIERSVWSCCLIQDELTY